MIHHANISCIWIGLVGKRALLSSKNAFQTTRSIVSKYGTFSRAGTFLRLAICCNAFTCDP